MEIVWANSDDTPVTSGPSGTNKVMTGHRIVLKLLGSGFGVITWKIYESNTVYQGAYKEFSWISDGSSGGIVALETGGQTIQIVWPKPGTYRVEVSTAAGTTDATFEVRRPTITTGAINLCNTATFSRALISPGETLFLLYQDSIADGIATSAQLLQFPGSGPDQEWCYIQILQSQTLFAKYELSQGGFQCEEAKGSNQYDRRKSGDPFPTRGFFQLPNAKPFDDSPRFEMTYNQLSLNVSLSFKTYLCYAPDNKDIPLNTPNSQRIGGNSELAPLKSMTWNLSMTAELVPVGSGSLKKPILTAFASSHTPWIDEITMPKWSAFVPIPPAWKIVQCP